MESDIFLARVGGIAVAVGLGAALVSGQGVAIAESTDGASASDSGADGGDSDTDPGPERDDTESDEDSTDESDAEESEDATAAEPEPDISDEESADAESVDDDEPVVVPPGDEAPAEETPAEEVDLDSAGDDGDGGVDGPAEPASPAAGRVSNYAVNEPDPSQGLLADAPLPMVAEISAIDESSVIVEAMVALDAPEPPSDAPVALTQAKVAVDAGAAMFGVAGPPGPGGPWHPPRRPHPPTLLDIAWAFFRRIESQFFNSTPTATYVVNPQQTGDTVITGAVVGRDVNRDPLTYTVVDQPDHGTVVVAPDGTFTYTPDPEWAHETAGPDSFTVVVSDRSRLPHLHLLSKTSHSTSVTVALDVETMNQAPTISVDEVVENDDGSVTYTVSTADADGDDVGVTVGALQYGEMSDHGDGTYTYTPDFNLTDTALTETIVFTATDGHGGQASAVELVQIDAATGQLVIDTVSIPATGQAVATTADGTRTFVGQGGRITVIDTTDPANPVVVSVNTSANAYEIAISDDGTRAYAVGGNGALIMVDASDLDNVIVKEVGLSQSLNDVAVTPDGNTVYVTTATTNRKIVRLDTSAGIENAVITDIPISTPSQYVEVSDDGTKVWVTTYEDEVLLINMTDPDNPVVSTVAIPNWSRDIAVSADGTRAVVLGYNNESYIVDASADFTTADVTTVNLGTRSVDVAITPDGSMVYFAPQQNSIIEVDLTDIDDPVITTIAADHDALMLVVSADGKRVYTANYGFESTSVFDTTTDTMLSTVHTGSRPVAVAVTADGSKAYVVNRDSKTVSIVEDFSV